MLEICNRMIDETRMKSLGAKKGRSPSLLSLADRIKPQVRYLQNSWERHSLVESPDFDNYLMLEYE